MVLSRVKKGRIMSDQRITPEIKRKILSWIRGTLGGLLVFAVVILFAGGRWDWLWGWIFIGLLTAAMAAHVLVLVPVNPALLADRSEGLRQVGTKAWDRPIVAIISVFLISSMILGGLDVRWGWSGELPLFVHLFGAVLYIIAWVIFLWAMARNPFFSESVHIQPGHQVVASGPYRVVRHPGYAGACLQFAATPLVLGSWWALIPAVLAVAGYVLRAALEDQTLQKELPGYLEYASGVRYRLFPGIW
jgi:protein-S-isoprenylcysteine O-methyltransferase Ste14